jgi:hypothetical protein
MFVQDILDADYSFTIAQSNYLVDGWFQDRYPHGLYIFTTHDPAR